MYYYYSKEKAWENDVSSGHVTSNDIISGDATIVDTSHHFLSDTM
jgi:hypothetical protein